MCVWGGGGHEINPQVLEILMDKGTQKVSKLKGLLKCNGLVNKNSPYFNRQISPSFTFSFSHIFSGGIPKETGLMTSFTSLVAEMSLAPI